MERALERLALALALVAAHGLALIFPLQLHGAIPRGERGSALGLLGFVSFLTLNVLAIVDAYALMACCVVCANARARHAQLLRAVVALACVAHVRANVLGYGDISVGASPAPPLTRHPRRA